MSIEEQDWGFIDHLPMVAAKGGVAALGEFVFLRVVDAKRQWNSTGDKKIVAADAQGDPDNRETMAYEVIAVGEAVDMPGVVKGNVVFHAACAAEETVFAGDDTFVSVHKDDLTNVVDVEKARAMVADYLAEQEAKQAELVAEWESAKKAGRVHV